MCSEGEELAAQLEALCGPSKEVSSMMTAKAGLVSRSKELFSQLDCGSNFDVEFQKASDLKRRKRTVVLDKVPAIIPVVFLEEEHIIIF